MRLKPRPCPAETEGAGRGAAAGGQAMARRPLAFGARFRAGDRTLRVRARGSRDGYVVEDARRGRGTSRRDHVSLAGALRDFAKAWRDRLN